MEKIKSFIESEAGKNILIVSIIILVGVASFELGRLSKKGNTSSGVKIEYPTIDKNQSGNVINSISTPQKDTNIGKSAINTINDQNSVENFFFASKRGKKYYPMNCSAGKNIKKENRIYFATREDAVNAGYELSSSCK